MLYGDPLAPGLEVVWEKQTEIDQADLLSPVSHMLGGCYASSVLQKAVLNKCCLLPSRGSSSGKQEERSREEKDVGFALPKLLPL